MHARAEEIRRQREKTVMRVLGTLSGFLMICLVAVMHQVNNMHSGVMTVHGTGTSLLSENAGAYVLIAVTAFFAGGIITAMAIRYRKRDSKEQNDKGTK